MTTITGASWVTSGTATTSSTGLSAISAGWTHVGSTDLPIGSASTGYIKTADDGGGTFRIDGTSVPLQGTDTEYLVGFWLRSASTATTKAADNVVSYLQSIVETSVTKHRCEMRLRNNTLLSGWAINDTNFITGSPVSEALAGGGASGASACTPHDSWVLVQIYVLKATAGIYAIYVNGCLVHRFTNLNTASLLDATLGSQWTLNFAATAGIRWEIAPLIESKSTSISVRPRYDLARSTDYLRQAHLCRWIDGSKGTWWSKISGTATVTPTTYATSGSMPGRYRFIIAGSGNSAVVETLDSIGTLPYNSRGWGVLVFPQTLVASATGSVSYRILATDNSVLTQFDFDGATGTLKNDGTTLVTISSTLRYFMTVEFNSSGAMAVSLLDCTSDLNTVIFSSYIRSWTPQSIGKIRVASTVGSLSVDHDGVYVMSTWDMAICDSLTAIQTTGLLPLYYTRNHLTANLHYGLEMQSIPGGMYAGRYYGQPHHCLLAIVGRPGRSSQSINTYVTPGLTNTYACRLIRFDGGSINDVVTATDASAAANVLSYLETHIKAQMTVAATNGFKIWLTTMIPRVQGTYSALQLQLIDDIATLVKRLVRGDGANDGQVYFSPVKENIPSLNYTVLYTSGDDTHFNASGDTTVADTQLRTMSLQINETILASLTASESLATSAQVSEVLASVVTSLDTLAVSATANPLLTSVITLVETLSASATVNEAIEVIADLIELVDSNAVVNETIGEQLQELLDELVDSAIQQTHDVLPDSILVLDLDSNLTMDCDTSLTMESP